MSHRPAVIAVAAAAVFTSGCFDIPPYQPPTSVKYTDDGAGGTAVGPDFSLHFASTGFHFPDKLLIGNVDILGHAPLGCHAESEVGIQVVPTLRISADSAATPATNGLVPVLRGPAAVQVKLDWASKFPCLGSTSVIPNGTTTFTVFPDGRIIRDDLLDDPNPKNTPPPVADVCRCDQNEMIDGFTVSSYWTFAQEHFQNFYTSDAPTTPVMLPIQDQDGVNGLSIACMAGDNSQVGFAWPTTDQTTVHGAGTLISFGRFNIINNTGMLDTVSWPNSLAMFIERGGNDCKAAIDRARAYNMPTMSALSINQGPSISASVHDGIYGGAGDKGPPGVMLSTDQVELSGTVAGSFAVWLRFPHAVDTLRATIKNPVGAWYVPQRVADDSWIVWFRDELTLDRPIMIQPN